MSEDQQISVITSCFNAESTLAVLMESILNQSRKPSEHIIIDGASKDNSVEVIRSFEPQYEKEGIRLIWLSEVDSGIYNAWNKGLKLATGDWIAFVGADDCYKEGALQTLSESANLGEYDFVTGKCEFVRGNKVIRKFGEPFNWSVFRKEMKILHAGGLHNAQYFKRFGVFDERFKIAGDYELLLRAGKGLRVQFIDQIIVSMGAEGVSSSEVFKVLNEARKARIKNKARNPLLAAWDMMVVYSKIKLKALVGK